MSLFLLLLLSSCAMFVNGSRQQIFIRGGLENETIKLKTPDGTFDIEGGSSAIMLTRSKSNIPVTVICPNNKRKSDIIETKFDWIWGGLGNLLNGGIGWFIDPFSSKAYVIDDLSISSHCKK